MNSEGPLLPFQAAGLWGGALEVGPHTTALCGRDLHLHLHLVTSRLDSEATGDHRLLLTPILPGGRRYDKELRDSMG